MYKMTQKIYEYIERKSLITQGNRVLVACSGGVDSVVLLHFLASNRHALQIEVAAAHVDHMLRGDESAADGLLVRSLCEEFNVPFFAGKVPVQDIVKTSGGNVQEVCREGRYSFFSKVMIEKGYDVLTTGHHAEDQLETILMQVTKGNPPSGIPSKRKIDGGLLVRPFLPVEKSSLYDYVREEKLEFREDPSNVSDAYMRNRFRNLLLPHILDENPRAAEQSVVVGERIREDEAYLKYLSEKELEKIIEFTDEGFPTIQQDLFTNVPTALQRRVIQLLLDYLYDKKKMAVHYKITMIEQLLHHFQSKDGNVSIDLPLGYRFVRAYDQLLFTKSTQAEIHQSHDVLCQGKVTYWDDDRWLYWSRIEEVEKEWLEKAEDIMYFNLPAKSLPLTVRQWKQGDRIELKGMAQSKRLSRLFIDEKVKKEDRIRLPIVVTADGIVCAVPGVRYGRQFTRHKRAVDQYILMMGNK